MNQVKQIQTDLSFDLAFILFLCVLVDEYHELGGQKFNLIQLKFADRRPLCSNYGLLHMDKYFHEARTFLTISIQNEQINLPFLSQSCHLFGRHPENQLLCRLSGKKKHNKGLFPEKFSFFIDFNFLASSKQIPCFQTSKQFRSLIQKIGFT